MLPPIPSAEKPQDRPANRLLSWYRRDPSFAWFVLGPAILLLSAVLFTPIIVRQYVRSQMSAEERSNYDEYLTAIPPFDPEWANPGPANVEQLAQALKLTELSEKFAKEPAEQLNTTATREIVERLYGGNQITPEELSHLREIVAGIQPFEQQARAIASAEYTLEGDSSQDFFAHQRLSKLLTLKAVLQCRDGNCSESLDLITVVLRLSKTSSISLLVNRVVAMAMQGNVSYGLEGIARYCSDPDALRLALSRINPVANSSAISSNTLQHGYDSIGTLHRWKRDGYPLDIEPGKRAPHYARQRAMLIVEASNYILDNLPPDDPRHQIYTYREPIGTTGKVFYWLAFYFGADYFYKVEITDLASARIRVASSSARLDLARLQMAQRILELDGRPIPTSAKAYVPEFFEAELKDPFTGAAYLWDDAHKRFYSPGPDQVDNNLTVTYDPTNGTVSSGDVVGKLSPKGS